MINRDDMLELTRRMTPARTCFDRIAGAYMDDMGEISDSFNVHFGKLSGSEKSRNLALFYSAFSAFCVFCGIFFAFLSKLTNSS